MSIDFNPLEIVARVWAMRYGKLLAIPSVGLLFVLILAVVLVGAHLALKAASDSSIGLNVVTEVLRGGLVCLNSAARFDKWNHAAVR